MVLMDDKVVASAPLHQSVSPQYRFGVVDAAWGAGAVPRQQLAIHELEALARERAQRRHLVRVFPLEWKRLVGEQHQQRIGRVQFIGGDRRVSCVARAQNGLSAGKTGEYP